jgi:hypothetical protein
VTILPREWVLKTIPLKQHSGPTHPEKGVCIPIDGPVRALGIALSLGEYIQCCRQHGSGFNMRQGAALLRLLPAVSEQGSDLHESKPQ